MRVLVYGAGKVGRALAAALRRAGGYQVTLRAVRAGLPNRCRAETVLLCVRDGDIQRAAAELAQQPWILGVGVALHVSGAVPWEALGELRSGVELTRSRSRQPGGKLTIALGQLHPMLSFASARRPPALLGGHALVAGEPAAVRAAEAIARSVGLVPRRLEGVDLRLYHAAAVMVAGGAVALASAGAALLEQGGVPRQLAPAVLGPLLASVAGNITSLGLPEALTGPVRRGAKAVVAGHLTAIEQALPALLPLYRALGAEQLALARALQDAPPADLEAVKALLGGVPAAGGARVSGRRRGAIAKRGGRA
ncbi:MAG: DUF2520 domain-containing protein [Polyangiaceae bacterium]|nr:DUF2520 domain-containing protein [Polyangiaceae bacterium]MCW5792642.1 DUF2520 domain-containing protein [Polyangiaceae bacterium]